MPFPLETSLFDSIGGLPLHPLVVHFAVVLLPLAALALVLEVLVPALRRRYAGVTVLALAGGTAAAFLAKESGEALARQEGLPAQHALVGNVLPWLAVALLVVAALWYVLQRRASGATRAASSPAVLASGLVAAVLALAVTVLSVVVGHTGATAVWNPDVPAAPASADPSPASTPIAATPSSPSVAPAASAAPTATVTPAPKATTNALTAAAVAQHASASSCWSIVNGNVYDLTTWIGRHPGGQQRILGICGKDGTAQFLAQHGSSSRVAQILAGFKLGPLAA